MSAMSVEASPSATWGVPLYSAEELADWAGEALGDRLNLEEGWIHARGVQTNCVEYVVFQFSAGGERVEVRVKLPIHHILSPLGRLTCTCSVGGQGDGFLAVSSCHMCCPEMMDLFRDMFCLPSALMDEICYHNISMSGVT